MQVGPGSGFFFGLGSASEFSQRSDPNPVTHGSASLVETTPLPWSIGTKEKQLYKEKKVLARMLASQGIQYNYPPIYLFSLQLSCSVLPILHRVASPASQYHLHYSLIDSP